MCVCVYKLSHRFMQNVFTYTYTLKARIIGSTNNNIHIKIFNGHCDIINHKGKQITEERVRLSRDTRQQMQVPTQEIFAPSCEG